MTFVSLNTTPAAQPTASGSVSTQSTTSTGTASSGGGFGSLVDQVAAALASVLGVPPANGGATADAAPAADAATTAGQTDEAALLAAAAAAQGAAAPAKVFVPGFQTTTTTADTAVPNPQTAPASAPAPTPSVDPLVAAIAAQAATPPQQAATTASQLVSTNAGTATAVASADSQAPVTDATAPVVTATDPQATAPTDATAVADPASGTPTVASPLGTLSQSLAELEKTLADGKPIDPAALDKLNKAVDAIAGMLGMTAQAPIVNNPIAPTPTTTTTTTTTVAAAAGLPQGVDPQSLLAGIAQQATDVASKLSGQQADLAAKLQAVGQRLGSGDLSAAASIKLGLMPAPATTPEDNFAAALKAQLGNAPVSGNTAAPAAFVAPQLKLPTNSALAPASAAKNDATVVSQPAPPVVPTPTVPTNLTVTPQLTDKAKDTPVTAATDAKATAAKVADAAAAAAAPAAAAAAPSDASVQATAQAVQASVQADPALSKVAPVAAAYAAVQSTVNLPQMAFEIVRHAQAGASHFQIRLDPPELGRIDVKMHVDTSGNLNAKMTVDRVETLDLLKRDSSTLERALSQAGLDSGSKTNLEFSLRQNPFARQDGQNPGNSPQNSGQDLASIDDETAAVPTTTLYRGTTSASGLNIFV